MVSQEIVQESAQVRVNSVLGPNRLLLVPKDGGHGWQVQDAQTRLELGSVTLSEKSAHVQSQDTVEFYEGKGGVTAILTSASGLKYFILPGGRVTLPSLSVSLPGAPIGANPAQTRKQIRRAEVQRVTPQAMILGAGLATRFEPISGDNTQYAKPSVPLVGDRSVIQCIAEAIARDHFTHLIINTFYKAQSLKASLAQVQGISLHYIDEAAPSGTAGALRKLMEEPQYAEHWDPTRPILVVQGDAVTDVNFSALMAAHQTNHAAVTIGCQVVRDEDVQKFGIIETDRSGADGHSGRIIGFMEKPPLAEAGPHRLGSTGFYLFSPQVYPLIRDVYHRKLASARAEAKRAGQSEPEEVLLDFALDLFPEILAQGDAMPMRAQVVEGYWCDIGNPAQYLETVHDVYAGKVDVGMPDTPGEYYENGVIYWPGAREKALREQSVCGGNVVVAQPFA